VVSVKGFSLAVIALKLMDAINSCAVTELVIILAVALITTPHSGGATRRCTFDCTFDEIAVTDRWHCQVITIQTYTSKLINQLFDCVGLPNAKMRKSID
jgi:hypothetical protein